MSIRNRQNGFSLIELLISLIVFSVGLLGIAGLQMKADYAARIIKRGVMRRQASITFPYLHLIGIYLLSLIPKHLGDKILLKLFEL